MFHCAFVFSADLWDRDAECCLHILDVLAQRWSSARHCHTALEKLLGRLNDRRSGVPAPLVDRGVLGKRTEGRPQDVVNGTSDGQRDKRPRFQDHSGRPQPVQDPGTVIGGGGHSVNGFEMGDCVPVMEYTGPDFGFDASRLGEGFFADPLDPDIGGLFGGVGWDTYF